MHIAVLGQEVRFSAQASSAKVGLQSRFQLCFTIENVAQITSFQPFLSQFAVVAGPMQSSSFSNINGSSSSSISYTYYLQPKSMGVFTIAPAIAVCDGKPLKCNAVKIEVVKGNTQGNNQAPSNAYVDPLLNDDPFFNQSKKAIRNKKGKIYTETDLRQKVFARVDVDKVKAYQGQQITANFNVYSQLPLEAGFKKLMSPEGFWTQDYTNDISPQESEKVMIDGKEFRKYTLRKTALFPTKTGALIIPSVDIQTNIDIGDNASDADNEDAMSSFLNQLFNGGETTSQIPLLLSTEPVTIQSMELPQQPVSFSQAVGRFSIESNISQTDMTTDQEATLVLTIKGDGNIKLLGKPNLQIPGDFESIDPDVFDTITSAGNELAGYKTFTYHLVPRNAGELHIPAANFTYFNPESNTYETVSSPSYAIKVKPGKNKGARSNKGLPKDIHDIVNDDSMQRNTTFILAEKIGYWSLYLLPIMGLLAANLFQKRKKYLKNTVETQKTKNAKQLAQQRLVIAHEMLKENNNNGFYNETAKAIWLYLSDKLSIPLSKLSKENMWSLMDGEGVPQEIKTKLQSITNECEQALYATGNNANMQQVYDDTVEVITELENKLNA
jgi:BatD DUF11 like domain